MRWRVARDIAAQTGEIALLYLLERTTTALRGGGKLWLWVDEDRRVDRDPGPQAHQSQWPARLQRQRRQ